MPLRLLQTIPMPGVKGRLDHLDLDVKGQRLFVSGLENGSVEVVAPDSWIQEAARNRVRCSTQQAFRGQRR